MHEFNSPGTHLVNDVKLRGQSETPARCSKPAPRPGSPFAAASGANLLRPKRGGSVAGFRACEQRIAVLIHQLHASEPREAASRACRRKPLRSYPFTRAAVSVTEGTRPVAMRFGRKSVMCKTAQTLEREGKPFSIARSAKQTAQLQANAQHTRALKVQVQR